MLAGNTLLLQITQQATSRLIKLAVSQYFMTVCLFKVCVHLQITELKHLYCAFQHMKNLQMQKNIDDIEIFKYSLWYII